MGRIEEQAEARRRQAAKEAERRTASARQESRKGEADRFAEAMKRASPRALAKDLRARRAAAEAGVEVTPEEVRAEIVIEDAGLQGEAAGRAAVEREAREEVKHRRAGES